MSIYVKETTRGSCLCTRTADIANTVPDLIFVTELESIKSLTGHNSIKRSKTLPFSKEKQG